MIDSVRRSAFSMAIAKRDDPNDGPMKKSGAVMAITSDRGESR